MLEIQVRLFGAFRDFADLPTLSITCAPGTSIAELRQKMQQNLMASKSGSHADELLKQSVFADEQAVLGETFILDRSQVLAIIPPVCGG